MQEYSKPPQPFIGEVPIDNVNSSLGNYEPRNDDEAYALELARAFVDCEGPAGLMLVGNNGNGKTHLAVSIARAIGQAGGNAVVLRFDGQEDVNLGIISIPEDTDRISEGWYGKEALLVSLFDVIVIDDMPGNLYPGVRSRLQKIVSESYQQGKKLVVTSNQSAADIATQLAESVDTSGFGAVEKTVAIMERIRQTWQTVEFAGPSFRNNQPKWWGGTERPATMPRSMDELVTELRNSASFPRLLGATILELAKKVGAEGPNLDKLARLLAQQKYDK